tara:strand:- start:448 stop:612 length:165 start_codon:yes stop_codon:yes gene_type:complete
MQLILIITETICDVRFSIDWTVDKVFIAELNLYKRKLFCTIEGEFVCMTEDVRV